MSDYTRIYDFSVKDSLPSGNASKLIKGSEVDGEFDALVTAVGTKGNKVSGGTEGNLVELSATGDLVDSSKDKNDFQLRDTDAVVNNLAKFDGNGDSVDAGLALGTVLDKDSITMLVNGTSWTDLYKGGWKPSFFNHQWGGARWGADEYEAATGHIASNSIVTIGSAAAATYGAQGFKVSEATSPPAVWVQMAKIGNPQNNLTLEIWSDTAGDPDAVVVNGAATEQDGVSHPATLGWVRFVFPTPPTLSANTQYHIVFTSSGAVDGSNYWTIGSDQVTASYPHGIWKNGDAVPAWTDFVGIDAAFILEDSAPLLVSGALVCSEGAPLDQSKGLTKPLSEFWNNGVGTLLVRSSTGFTADKTIADAQYGLDHDRIVLRCNVTTGFPQVDLYESDGTKHTITGTTDLTSGTPDVAVRWRSEADGSDYLDLLVDGVAEGTPITSATITLSPLMRQLGHLTLGGGLPVAPTWDEDEDMSALPSAGSWTWTGTATEAAAMVVADGKLYQNGSGYASTHSGYYTVTTTLNNTNGWTVATKLQVVDGQNLVSNPSITLDISDGTKHIGLFFHDYFIELFDDASVGFIQVDLTDRQHTLVMQGKGTDFYIYIDGKLVWDGTGQLDQATATNAVVFGDTSTGAGVNASAIWDYVKYYDTAWTPPEFNDCTITEAACWQADANTILNNIGSSTIKNTCGVKHNYVEAVEGSYSARGITANPSTASTTPAVLAEMQRFVLASSLVDVQGSGTFYNDTASQSVAIRVALGGTSSVFTESYSTSSTGSFSNALSTLESSEVGPGLHYAEIKFLATGNNALCFDTRRIMTVKSK